jgi:sulfotransferase family protein
MLKRAAARAQKLGLALRRSAGGSRTLKQGYRWLMTRYRRVSDTGIKPEKIIWIFGSARSGSTWLRNMMKDLDHHQLWEEPLVGQLFGDFRNRVAEVELRRPDFVMSDATREGWTRAIRNFVLDCASYSRPTLSSEDYLVIKEPNGSIGAPLMMEALPESRMVLLVRDPRDIVSSMLDGAREGGWMYERREGSEDWKRRTRADQDPDTFIRNRSRKYLQHATSAKEAYDAHRGRKVLVRYEELRADTLGAMRRMYSALGIEVDEEELKRVVEKHSWENIPEEEKGEGKFYRKAKPGGWREDLTPEQAEAVERVTAPLIEEFYSSG